MGYHRGSKNPIYAYKHFADYRNKVMQKELEKEEPVWPVWLEDAFLDALLLIPQMARKKFSSKAVLYGRNMLITEYLWIYHWRLHPPPPGERIPDRKQREKCNNRKPHKMFRGRKQVSSHIQVLKGFFQTLPTFHFIFPSKKDAKVDDRKYIKEDEDTESFKNNRVLIAIADGRLPDERPNYDYFGRLLGADNDVFLRPKQCWIFVSSSEVTLKERHVTADDGTTRKQIAGYNMDGQRILGEADYPHLRLNEDKDYKSLSCNGEPTVLLHEYTRALTQKESCSIREISGRWGQRFPELVEKLHTAVAAESPGDERTSRCVVGPCDLFHFEVVLDLHANSKFPDGSHCNGVVELAIARPDLLHGHSWRSVTTVVKPDALHFDDKEPDYHDRASAVDVIPSHRPGCAAAGLSGPGPQQQQQHHNHHHHYRACDCAARGSRDTIGVRFPASSWANTFVMLAPYVSAAREERERESDPSFTSGSSSSSSGKDQRGRQTSVKEEDDLATKQGSSSSSANNKKTEPKPVKGSKQKALMDVLQEVAMYQEIWSAPPPSANDGGGGSEGEGGGGGGGGGKRQQTWTRRAVLLWTFAPVHEHKDDKGKTSVTPAGTNWRFMSKLDPTSQYHQQRAYLSGSPSVVKREAVMSPNPGYAHHAQAAMHEHFGAASTSASVSSYDHHYEPQHQHQHQHQHQQSGGLGIPGPNAAQHHPHHYQHHHSHHSHIPGGLASAAGSSHLSGLSLLDTTGYVDVGGGGGSDGGLATPPPTASLQSSGYGHGFDDPVLSGRSRGSIAGSSIVSIGSSNSGGDAVTGGGLHHHHAQQHLSHPQHQHQHQNQHHHLDFMSTAVDDAGGVTSCAAAAAAAAAAADPFLSGLGLPQSTTSTAAAGYEETAPDDCCDAGLQSTWSGVGGLQGLLVEDPAPWSVVPSTTASWGEDLIAATLSSTAPTTAALAGGIGAGVGVGVDSTLWSSPPDGLSQEFQHHQHSQQQHQQQQQQQQQQQHHITGHQNHNQEDQQQYPWAAWGAIEEDAVSTGARQPWDDGGDHHPHHHHHQNHQTTADGHDGFLLPSSGGGGGSGSGLTPLRSSRKRSRGSLDDDDGDTDAPYHVSSMRKLNHGGRAPIAAMGDDEFHL